MKRIAVLASGNGSNFQAIVDAVNKGEIKDARVCLLVCDNKKAFCLERAKLAGVKTVLIERNNFSDRQKFEERILSALGGEKIDLICLAGFMRILSPDFIQKYKNKILNIHPSLLPAFKGAQAVKDALEGKAEVTGATVHIATEMLDSGPIIVQEAVKIYPGDTEESLLQRIHEKEHKIYPEAVDLFCRGKLRITAAGVKILALAGLVLIVLSAGVVYAEENAADKRHFICHSFSPRSYMTFGEEIVFRQSILNNKDIFYDKQAEDWKPLTEREYEECRKALIYKSAAITAELFNTYYLSFISEGISRIIDYANCFEQKIEKNAPGYEVGFDFETKETMFSYEKKY